MILFTVVFSSNIFKKPFVYDRIGSDSFLMCNLLFLIQSFVSQSHWRGDWSTGPVVLAPGLCSRSFGGRLGAGTVAAGWDWEPRSGSVIITSKTQIAKIENEILKHLQSSVKQGNFKSQSINYYNCQPCRWTLRPTPSRGTQHVEEATCDRFDWANTRRRRNRERERERELGKIRIPNCVCGSSQISNIWICAISSEIRTSAVASGTRPHPVHWKRSLTW